MGHKKLILRASRGNPLVVKMERVKTQMMFNDVALFLQARKHEKTFALSVRVFFCPKSLHTFIFHKLRNSLQSSALNIVLVYWQSYLL